MSRLLLLSLTLVVAPALTHASLLTTTTGSENCLPILTPVRIVAPLAEEPSSPSDQQHNDTTRWWFVVDDALSEPAVDEIVSLARRTEERNSSAFQHSMRGDGESMGYRTARLEPDSLASRRAFDDVKRAVLHNFGLNHDATQYPDDGLIIRRYRANEAENVVHIDHANNEVVVFTAIVYLSNTPTNDSSDEGSTTFVNGGPSVAPKKGRMLIFRSRDERGNVLEKSAHRGVPFTNEDHEKYILLFDIPMQRGIFDGDARPSPAWFSHPDSVAPENRLKHLRVESAAEHVVETPTSAACVDCSKFARDRARCDLKNCKFVDRTVPAIKDTLKRVFGSVAVGYQKCRSDFGCKGLPGLGVQLCNYKCLSMCKLDPDCVVKRNPETGKRRCTLKSSKRQCGCIANGGRNDDCAQSCCSGFCLPEGGPCNGQSYGVCFSGTLC